MSQKTMGMLTVLVTGVGAIIGQGIVKGLRRSARTIRVIGMDRNACSPGPSFCDAFFKKPDTDERLSDYLDFWREIVRDEGIDLILPGLEVDVAFLDKHRTAFAHWGVAVALNHSELIELAADKWRMGQALQDYGLPAIPSLLAPSWAQALEVLGPPPLLLKPRRGSGSKGIIRLVNEADFLYWSAKEDGDGDWMLQRLVGSDQDEYTVGVFGLGDGSSIPPIIFRRRLSATGSTGQAEVVQDPVIERMTALLTERFQPQGPTNYQFRKEGEIAYLLEINPRFSSSNSLRSAFGYNEADMSIDYFVRGRTPKAPTIRPGIAWRYSEDFVIHDRHPV